MSWPLLRVVLVTVALAVACASSQEGGVADVADVADVAHLEASVRSVLYWEGLPAAVLVVDNASGVIIDSVVVGETATAPLGGGLRPAGSVMKVLVLAAAIEVGMKPEDVLEVPRCIELQQHSACAKTPGDYTIAEAITASINPAFILLADSVPRGVVVEDGARFGMQLEETPAVALGIHPVSMESVAALFVAIASDGETRAITGKDGSTVIAASGRYVSDATASVLRSLLRSVVTDGTGVAANGADAPFGKTGTASGQTDGWFVGSTATHTIVVWVGSADGVTSVGPPRFPGSLAGGGWPAEIFRVVADGVNAVTPP